MGAIRRSFLKAGEALPKYMGVNVVNKTGATLSKGTLVYVSGFDTTTGFYRVSKADPDVAGALPGWVLTDSLADGSTAVAVRAFTHKNVNTSGAAVGDPVYADPSNPGGWTLTAPSGGGVSTAVVGRVRSVSATEGQVEFDLIANERAGKLGNRLFQAGLLSADATGRALMATGFFDAATALAKVAANAFDAAFCASAFATGAIPASKLSENAIRYADVSLTNAQLKALRATPIELVPAPGAGKFIEFVSAVPFLDYGSSALTRPGGDEDLVVRYENGTGPVASEASLATFITATADSTQTLSRAVAAVLARTSVENKALVLHNDGSQEFGGNAGNDTVLRVKVAYRVHSTGW